MINLQKCIFLHEKFLGPDNKQINTLLVTRDSPHGRLTLKLLPLLIGQIFVTGCITSGATCRLPLELVVAATIGSDWREGQNF